MVQFCFAFVNWPNKLIPKLRQKWNIVNTETSPIGDYRESELVVIDPLPSVDGAGVVPLGQDAGGGDAGRADEHAAATWAQCYKTFFGRNLRISVLS